MLIQPHNLLLYYSRIGIKKSYLIWKPKWYKHFTTCNYCVYIVILDQTPISKTCNEPGHNAYMVHAC